MYIAYNFNYMKRARTTFRKLKVFMKLKYIGKLVIGTSFPKVQPSSPVLLPIMP